jgi:hypothetical protein
MIFEVIKAPKFADYYKKVCTPRTSFGIHHHLEMLKLEKWHLNFIDLHTEGNFKYNKQAPKVHSVPDFTSCTHVIWQRSFRIIKQPYHLKYISANQYFGTIES